MRRILNWLFLLLALLLSPPARGLSISEPPASRTIEWFVADSDAILRGVVREVTERQVGRGNTFATVTVAVVETYKGEPLEPGAVITFTARNTAARIWRERGKTGDQYLFFLVRTAQHIASRPAAAELADGWNAAPYVMRDYHAVAPILMHDRPDQQLYGYTGGLRQFQSPREVIDALKGLVARGSKDYRGEFSIRFSPKSEVLKSAAPRSAFETPAAEYALTSLIIPLDEHAEVDARKWVASRDAIDRHNGASVLAQFRSEQNATILRALLSDPFAADWRWPGAYGSSFLLEDRPGKWHEQPHPVRQLAWDALSRWGMAPAEVVLGSPRYPASYPGRWYFVTMLITLALVLLVVLLRGWLGGRRPGRRPRLLAGAGGVSFLLLLIVASLWLRSRWRIDDLVIRSGPNSRIELALLPGGLRVMSFNKWAQASPIAFTTVPRTTKAEQDWLYRDSSTPVPGRKGRAGFYRDTGSMAGPGLGRGVTYTAWTVPYWALAAVFSIPVLGRLMIVASKWRQRAQGLCPKCGYDLRATPGRCPECGTVFAPGSVSVRQSGSSLAAPIPA